MNLPFHPTAGATKNISAGVASSNVNLIAAGAAPGTIQVMVYNSGTATVFIRQGADNTVAATLAADTPIPPGSLQVLSFNAPASSNSGLWIAAISASAAQTIYFTPGAGI